MPTSRPSACRPRRAGGRPGNTLGSARPRRPPSSPADLGRRRRPDRPRPRCRPGSRRRTSQGSVRSRVACVLRSGGTARSHREGARTQTLCSRFIGLGRWGHSLWGVRAFEPDAGPLMRPKVAARHAPTRGCHIESIHGLYAATNRQDGVQRAVYTSFRSGYAPAKRRRPMHPNTFKRGEPRASRMQS